jgi:soluble lytic murein transglycosylase-like protein
MAAARKRRNSNRKRRPRPGWKGGLAVVCVLGVSFALSAAVQDLLFHQQPRSVRASIGYWASVYGVDPHLARAVAWNESGFNPHRVSATGARGVMQVEPSTWLYVEQRILGRRVRHTGEGGVQVGIAYLHYLLLRFGGNRMLALAAYYEGPAAVERDGVYPSSRRYVANVLALRERF